MAIKNQLNVIGMRVMVGGSLACPRAPCRACGEEEIKSNQIKLNQIKINKSLIMPAGGIIMHDNIIIWWR